MHPAAEAVKKFADEQTDKMNEMVDSIRAIHGNEVSGRMRLVGNMLATQTQVNTTLLGMFQFSAEIMEPKMIADGLVCVMELILRNKVLSRAIFLELFCEDKLRKEMEPFYDGMLELQNTIVRKIEAVKS